MRSLAARAALASALAAALFVPLASGAATPPSSWAKPQIAAVLDAGVMSGDQQTFRPDDPITQTELDGLIGTLTQQPVAAAVADQPVTMAGLDHQLVDALGLGPEAQQFGDVARAAGLKVPDRFGSEVVARLLGLRTNHPAKQDSLELLPGDPATRAEAAYSAARILSFTGDETQLLQDAAATFAIPALSTWQKRIVTTAFSFIGYPYVWGGTSEGPESLFGVDSRGGFDCSGFVWRVYKLQRYPDGGALAATLEGRTAAQMSREVPRTERIPLAELQPGDVLFFGATGARSKPAQVDHAGIYVGSGWFVHSSRYGVALAQLDGWYLDRFAWARRPLAEAGLSA
jgi:cell wall-associated NlpC family hydrolase